MIDGTRGDVLGPVGRTTAADPPAGAQAGERAPRIRLRGVAQQFGDHRVLDDVDLDVAPGELVVLLGRSGSGKSTLLRLLAGLDAPSSGTVAVSGSTAVAFQEARLLPWRRVVRNVQFGLPRTRASAERLGAAHAALREVGLEHRADAWPTTLSGGEAQRASLARALAREPDVLLLDEPFGALDALTRRTMQALVLDLWRKHGLSIVMVTHDVSEAILLADRILVLENGRIAHAEAVPAARPRTHADPALAELEERLLRHLGVA